MFLLYYKPNCPHSINTHKKMDEMSLDYIKIDTDMSNSTIKNESNQQFNHTTFPIILYYKSNELNNKTLSDHIPSGGIFLGDNTKFINLLKLINELNVDNIREKYKDVKKNNNMKYRDFLSIAIDILNKNKKN